MKKHFKFIKKICVGVLTLGIVLSCMTGIVSVASAAENVQDTRITDASTLNSWKKYIGEDATNSEYSGGVWSDKSVFKAEQDFSGAEDNSIKLSPSDDNFLVALSTMASNKSITGYDTIPTDTMLVLDISSSMYNGSNRNPETVKQMVSAVNQSIKNVQALNNYNRVGVVLYYGGGQLNPQSTSAHSAVLLPLSRYSHNKDEYLKVNTSSNKIASIAVNSNVTDVETNKFVTGTYNTPDIAGTYTQLGIINGLNEMLKKSPKIPSDASFQAGVTRMPIMVLMSDGEPTAATNAFAAPGNALWGNNRIDIRSAAETDFVTQLTAAYARKKLDDHYLDRTPSFYTLSLGTSISYDVMDPKGNDEAMAELRKNGNNSTPVQVNQVINTYWNNLIKDKTVSFTVKYCNSSWDATNLSNKTYTVSKSNNYLPSSVDEKYYVDQAFTAETGDELQSVFTAIVEKITIQSKYLPTDVLYDADYEGYITFIDNIGEYMEIKDVKGIVAHDTFFDGHSLAQNFVEGNNGGILGTIDSPTPLGDNFIWAIAERLGIENYQARALVTYAYEYGQLYYNSATDYSNAFYWYADKDGKYIGFYDKNFNEPAIKPTYLCKSYLYVDYTQINTNQNDASNLMYISVRIMEHLETGEQTIMWSIPASLIPLISRSFEISGSSLENPGTVKLTSIENAVPLRLIYEVGLDEKINEYTVSEVVDDDYEYINSDGHYEFYTNKFDTSTIDSDSNPQDKVNTISYFIPSQENERYYYSEDTKLYVAEGGQYVEYSGNNPANESTAIYRRINVFDWSDTNDVKLTYVYEEVAKANLARAKEENGNWYIPINTPASKDLPPIVNPDNLTQTLKYALYPSSETRDGVYYVDSILGNNGKISLNPQTGLKISKKVNVVDPGQSPEFTINIEADDSTLNDEFTAVYVNSEGTAVKNTISFENGKAIVKLKKDCSVYIYTLPEDMTFTISELETNGSHGCDGYDLIKTTVDGKDVTEASVKIKKFEIIDVEFTNSLDVDGELVIRKILNHTLGEGHEIPSDLSYTFKLKFEGNNYVSGDKFDISGNKTITLDDDLSAELTLEPGMSVAVYDILKDTKVTITELYPGYGYKETETDRTKVIEIEANKANLVSFTNTYEPAPASSVNLKVNGIKNLIGRDWKDGDKFEFLLEYHDSSEADPWIDIDTEEVIYNAENDSFNKFSFTDDADEPIFNISFDEKGVYAFRMSEISGNIGGITYDNIISYFDVTVDDMDFDGFLEIVDISGQRDVTITKPANGSNDFIIDVVYNNEYAPEGSASAAVNITKVLEDKSGQNILPEGFVFDLLTKDSENVLSSAVTTSAGETSISLVYTSEQVGQTFTYQLVENTTNKIDAMDYDDTVYEICVHVKDNLDGTISALIFEKPDNCEIIDGEEVIPVPVDAVSELDLTFENVYDPMDGETTISGEKHLIGRDLKESEFTFELYETDSDFVIADDAQPIDTAENTADESFEFDEITYSEVGTWYYVVKESDADLPPAVTHDSSVFYVTVEVTDDCSGQLKAVQTITDELGESSEIEFNNLYFVEPTSVVFDGRKALSGKTLRNGAFTFELYQTDANFDISSEPIQTVKNDAEGKFSFDEIGFEVEGEAYYVIKESIPSETNGITYDTAQYRITVKITDDEIGALHNTVSIEYCKDGNTASAEEILFRNTYKAEDASVVLKGTKKFTGATLKEGMFSFKLYSADSAYLFTKDDLIDTVKNAEDGSFTFKPFTYNETGEWYYVIKEDVSNKLENVKYDGIAYGIKITVTNNGKGQLVADTEIIKQGKTVDEITFTNTYEAPNKPNKPTGSGGGTPQNNTDKLPLGDETNLTLWIMISAAAIIFMLALVLMIRKRSKN